MDLEPIDSGRADDPVVSDVNGRLWRVGRPPTGAVDLALAVLVLLVFTAIAAALML